MPENLCLNLPDSCFEGFTGGNKKFLQVVSEVYHHGYLEP